MRYLFVISLLLLLVAACAPPQEHNAVYFVFGTNVEVSLRDTDETKASEAFGLLQQRFQSMHRDWHAWEKGRLTDINLAFAENRQTDVPEDIATLIRRSQTLENATSGRFNPAIGGLIALWGFHTSKYPITGPPPQMTAIQGWLDQHPSCADIKLDGHRVSSRNPAVQLDFGGIAKGYAVDIARELLGGIGVQSAIINAGGDLRAFGGGSKNPWKIAVENPAGGIIGVINVSGDEAVFTSGNAYRFRQDDQQRYPHIIDPVTGWPVTGLSSATVIADEGVLADVAATALIIAGENGWPQQAVALGLDLVLVINDRGKVFMTEKMQQRLSLGSGVPAEIEFEVVKLPDP